MKKDIRWQQRFANFKLALSELTAAVQLAKKRPLSNLEEQGLIQSFEYNYELAWNCMKDFYQNQGDTNIAGSRDAIRLAFKRGLIVQGDIWMDMVNSRVSTSHTYNKEMAGIVAKKIIDHYYPEFIALEKALQKVEK